MKVPDVWKEIFWLVLICSLFGFLHHGGSFIAPLQYFFFTNMFTHILLNSIFCDTANQKWNPIHRDPMYCVPVVIILFHFQ